MVTLFVVLTIATVVAFAGYAWQQRHVASETLERADKMVREAQTARTGAEKMLKGAAHLDYQARVLYHFLGIDALTTAEYETLMEMLKDNPKATKVSEVYEMWAKTSGEELADDRRSYPNMISHLVVQVHTYRKQLASMDTAVKRLETERDRFRQEADEYRTRCRRPQEEIDKLREP